MKYVRSKCVQRMSMKKEKYDGNRNSDQDSKSCKIPTEVLRNLDEAMGNYKLGNVSVSVDLSDF